MLLTGQSVVTATKIDVDFAILFVANMHVYAHLHACVQKEFICAYLHDIVSYVVSLSFLLRYWLATQIDIRPTTVQYNCMPPSEEFLTADIRPLSLNIFIPGQCHCHCRVFVYQLSNCVIRVILYPGSIGMVGTLSLHSAVLWCSLLAPAEPIITTDNLYTCSIFCRVQ